MRIYFVVTPNGDKNICRVVMRKWRRPVKTFFLPVGAPRALHSHYFQVVCPRTRGCGSSGRVGMVHERNQCRALAPLLLCLRMREVVVRSAA